MSASSSWCRRALAKAFQDAETRCHQVNTATAIARRGLHLTAGRFDVLPDAGVSGPSGQSPTTQECEKVTRTIFEAFKDPHSGTVNTGRLLAEIMRTGIRPRTDPRLASFVSSLTDANRRLTKSSLTPIEALELDAATLMPLVDQSVVLLGDIFQNRLVVPEFGVFCERLESIFERCADNKGGKVADYIPQLAKFSPDLWACSVCTVDGQRFSIGDIDTKFSIQSCSKPFTYAICLNELGCETVHDFVGTEPSGRNFNEICLDSKNKPHNPMLNSGAIMISALSLCKMHPEMGHADKFDYMQKYLERIAGNQSLGFENSVYLSERDTADRNFAMAYFMKEHRCFPKNFNLQECMDLYFQFCSMEVDTEALSVMGATLANGGICPLTGEKVLNSDCVRDVLSLMFTCGMYNYSGEFAFLVGLPAKSGVSGCLVLVVPNVVSIALWSPPLDRIGNSVRGLQFAKELTEVFNFHRFDNLRHSEKKEDPRRESFEKRGLTVTALLFATHAGDITAIRRHFMQGSDLNEGDYDGRTALHMAAAEGQLECARFLLEKAKVNVSPKDRWGHTPLKEAERFGHEKLVKLIKKHEKED